MVGEEEIPVCVDNAAIKASILYSFYQYSGACLVGIEVYLHLGAAITTVYIRWTAVSTKLIMAHKATHCIMLLSAIVHTNVTDVVHTEACEAEASRLKLGGYIPQLSQQEG